MFDRHVHWYLSASWILLVLLAFLGTNNAAFTRSVTLMVAAIVVLPLLLFALFNGRQPAAPAPARGSGIRRSHRRDGSDPDGQRQEGDQL